MRSTIIAAAFVAGAIAVPYQKRDVVTDVDMVYVTDIVTVTAGQPAAYFTAPVDSTTVESTTIESAAAESTTVAHKAAHYGHHSYHWSVVTSSSSSEAAPVESSSSEAAPTTSSTSEYVAPTTSSSSEYVAPTTSSTSEYVAPTTSSTSEYVAPSPTSTYVAPTSTSVYVAPSSTSTSEWVAPTSYAASSSSAVSTADSTSESSAAPTDYQSTALYHHNVHRANHSAIDIKWSETLASLAKDIAGNCIYAHNMTAGNGGYGQNIAAGSDSIAAVITGQFYNGEVNWFNGLYGAANPDMSHFENWGHFSQIVWNDTTEVGCFTQQCPNGLGNIQSGSGISPVFTVCNYSPPGNFGGEYGDNIFPSLDRASVIVPS